VLHGTELEFLQSVSEEMAACAVCTCVEFYYIEWRKSHLPFDM